MAAPPPDKQSCDYYFDSYSHFGVHEDLLKDEVRTGSYERAIDGNRSLFAGKTVLDAGAGTGILSMLAARCGARKVYAVEKCSIAGIARQIISLNGFDGQIEVIEDAIEDVALPEQVDVIVSEWMGYCLLYESMLLNIIVARDRFMRPGGTMFPSRARLVIAGIEDANYRQKKLGFWDNVYGFSFAPVKLWALREVLIEACPTDRIITQSHVVVEFDLNICTASELAINAPFTLAPTANEELHAFVVWFDVIFAGPETMIELSTSPYSDSTHWNQSIFYIEEPVMVTQDLVINGNFQMRSNKMNTKEIDFLIAYEIDGMHYTQTYKMQ
jgi:protein arginine N-methyltransferase 1